MSNVKFFLYYGDEAREVSRKQWEEDWRGWWATAGRHHGERRA